ncbi:aminotransferase class III-fold pyridoxal phosphate-dependent enzyme [Streptomyces sp. NPDC002018]|uniref:aminotransferase class III-fold pyridoxal phosphate-dependent enzyme n=1 Tax=Streptomyces sp. NPDC002018 TaxID=3364629 RepID=UPI0036AAA80A
MSAVYPLYPESRKLLERARHVIPGGVWGHNRFPSAYDPDELPWFAEHAEGARLRDVDGNWYTDYICGFGAMINGYARSEIDEAVRVQATRGSTLSLATARTVELAELLVDMVDGMSWVTYGSSGSDATWSAAVIARAHTGRSLVGCVEGAYHGSHAWSGQPDESQGRYHDDSAIVRKVLWNDIEGLSKLFTEYGDQLAAFFVTPYHHPIPGEAELPDREWVNTLHELCGRHGTLLVIDDVRAGFRLDLRGSHAAFGLRPDLVCFSKGLGNGWPLSAVLGRAALRDTSEKIFLAGTFWNSGNAMAAAIANLGLLRSEDGVERMRVSGKLLVDGLRHTAERHGAPLRVTGPEAMPSVTADGDEGAQWMRRFAVHMARQGSLIHAGHNWALSTVHDSGTVEETLDHADQAVQRTQEELSG